MIILSRFICCCHDLVFCHRLTSCTHTGFIFLECVVAVMSGAVLPLQASINKLLATVVLSRFRASCISSTVGTICTSIATLLFHYLVTPLSFAKLSVGNLWLWTSGFIGVVYVFSSIFFPSIIGLSLFFMLLISGQLTASLVLDAVGAFGLPVVPASTPRIVAVCLACVGCTCVQIDVVAKARSLLFRFIRERPRPAAYDAVDLKSAEVGVETPPQLPAAGTVELTDASHHNGNAMLSHRSPSAPSLHGDVAIVARLYAALPERREV